MSSQRTWASMEVISMEGARRTMFSKRVATEVTWHYGARLSTNPRSLFCTNCRCLPPLPSTTCTHMHTRLGTAINMTMVIESVCTSDALCRPCRARFARPRRGPTLKARDLRRGRLEFLAGGIDGRFVCHHSLRVTMAGAGLARRIRKRELRNLGGTASSRPL